MNRRSTEFTEAHFDAKAERYQAALRTAPYARTLEVLPFLLLMNDRLLLDPRQQTAADLLCGSGFLTSGLRGCFKRTVGIDVSARMLAKYPAGPDTSSIKAPLDEQSSVLVGSVQPAAIVALAGLHHVYVESENHIDRFASDSLQAEAILAWASSLPPGGVAVVADVTDPDLPVAYSSDLSTLAIRHRTFTERFASLVCQTAKCVGDCLPIPSSVASYVHSVTACCSQTTLPEPGNWFRHVVSEHGLYGHVDHFLNPVAIADLVSKAGFDVSYYEIPTPWIFGSEDAFLSFFYDKFAFGPRVGSLEEIPAGIKRLIRSRAQHYLGVRCLPNGCVSVGWRLGYYVVANREPT